jgi:hypothetical protein
MLDLIVRHAVLHFFIYTVVTVPVWASPVRPLMVDKKNTNPKLKPVL